MQAMNHFGNRGFGGPPQPQRQGGRRGNNRGGGGFRGGNNSRFDNNQQRPQNQGGQRPNEGKQDNRPPQNQQNQGQQQQQNQQKPVQNEPKQQLQKEQPVVKPAPVQQVQQAPPANKPDLKDQVDNVAKDKPKNEPANQIQQQPKNVNGVGNFAGNKRPASNWSQGGGNQGNQGGFQDHQGNQGGRQANQSGHQGNQGGHQGNQGGFQGNQGGFQGNQGGFQGNQGAPGNRPFGNRLSGGPPGGPQARNQQRNPNFKGGLKQDGNPAVREENMLANKLKELQGPLYDLPPLDQTELKFSGRSRLYIGNLTPDATEEEILKLFAPYGETAELFLNKEKNFGFIKMDNRANAEKAKHELDGKMRNGRNLKVRFAPHNSAIRVKNLPPFVSNELLYHAFEIFGKIERAYIKVDERGRPLGEGVVEYVRKPSALAAIRNCTEKCFFLTTSLRPVIVENYEEPDEADGYPEKNLPRKNPEYLKAREVGPRFSELNSFEHEYGTRWKQLHELHRQKEEALKKELAAEEEKLEAQMEFAKYEHETEMLRQQLQQREQDRERQKRSWELAERAAEERRDQERAHLQRQEEELSRRMRAQDDELRRRQQENTLFVQAQRLNSMLDRQEQGMFDTQQPMEGGGYRNQYDGPRGFDDMPSNRWEGPRQDDFPNKRRRF